MTVKENKLPSNQRSIAYKQLRRFEKELDHLIKKELPNIPAKDIEHFFLEITIGDYLTMVLEEDTELMEEEEIKSAGKVSPKSEADSEKTGKTSKDKNTSPFSPPLSSPKQRIKFKNWEAIATAKSGTLYKEVIDRFLVEYKDGIEPLIEKLSQIIREMYGKELKDTSIATYVSTYKRYIRENELCQNIIPPHPKEVLIHPFKKLNDYKTSIHLREIPIEKVAEIWNLLPDKFTYKQVKALIPAGTMQSGARIDACNYTLREFKENPAFECEETSPGVFLKKESVE